MRTLSKLIFATTAGALLGTGANAETFNVTAEVSNTIALTETTPLDFGTLFIRRGLDSGGAAGAALVLGTDGTFSGTGTGAEGGAGTDIVSRVVSLGGSSPATLSVTGASAFANLTITLGTTTPLIHSSANPSLPTITLGTLTSNPTTAAGLTLDASGNGNIVIGATITASTVTGTTAGTAYADGTYTGTYAVSVSY